MAKKENALSVAKKVLQDILGLDSKTTENVLRIVKSGGHLPGLKTQLMRKRVGARAMTMLAKTLEAAAEETANNKNDEAPEEDKKEDKKEDVKESTFLNYLMTELADEGGMDVDYTGTDDSKLTSQQKAQKRSQMKDDPTKRRLDKETRGADTMQKKIAAENKRHMLAVKNIRDAEKSTGE